MGWFSRLFRRKRSPSTPAGATSLFTASAPPTTEPATDDRSAAADVAPPEPAAVATEDTADVAPPEPAPVPTEETAEGLAQELAELALEAPATDTAEAQPEPTSDAPPAVEAWRQYVSDDLDVAVVEPDIPEPDVADPAPGLGVRVHDDRLDRTGAPRTELTPSQAIALAQEGPRALERRLRAVPEDDTPES